MSEDDIRAIVAEATTLLAGASSETENAIRLQLRALLRRLAPDRARAGGMPLRYASLTALVEAIQAEAALALKRLPGGVAPFREVERRFRASAGVSTPENAVAVGALDFSAAAERIKRGEGLPAGCDIVCVFPPLGSPARPLGSESRDIDEAVRSATAGASAVLPLDACEASRSAAAALRRLPSSFAPLGVYCLWSRPGFFMIPGAISGGEDSSAEAAAAGSAHRAYGAGAGARSGSPGGESVGVPVDSPSALPGCGGDGSAVHASSSSEATDAHALAAGRAQAAWARRLLRLYAEPPNRRNLDAFRDPDLSQVVWAAGRGQRLQVEDASLVPAVLAATPLQPGIKVVEAGAAAGGGAATRGAGAAVGPGAKAAAGGASVAEVACASGGAGDSLAMLTPRNEGAGSAAGEVCSAARGVSSTVVGSGADSGCSGADAPCGGADGEVGHAPMFQRRLWRDFAAQHCTAARSANTVGASSDAPPLASADSVDAGSHYAPDASSCTDKVWGGGVAPPPPPPAPTAPSSALLELSWSTLGTQYDWTNRTYHLPSDPDFEAHVALHPAGAARWSVAFPSLLREWGQAFVRRLQTAVTPHFSSPTSDATRCAGADDGSAAASAASGSVPAAASPAAFPALPGVDAHGLPLSLVPQAGIANFYCASPTKLAMGAHVDDMERTREHPVLSLSLGCAAVFLLGGRAVSDVPTPLLLRSGDAMLLAGACRLAYHGVARVFEDSSPPALLQALHPARSCECALSRASSPTDGASAAEGAVAAAAPTTSLQAAREASDPLASQAQCPCSSSSALLPAAAWPPSPQEEEAAGEPGCACEEAALRAYLRRARLNLNVRQVL